MRRALFLVAVGLVLAGCGGAASLDPVAQAADKSRGVATVRFRLAAAMGEGSSNTAFTATGAIADHGDTVAMDLQIPKSKGQPAFNARMVLRPGGTIYMRSAQFRDAMPAGKHWVSLPAGDLSVNAAPNDPTQWLEYLKTVGDVQQVGHATINGRPSTHFRARIDIDKAVQKANTASRKQLRLVADAAKMIGLTTIPVDVWVGDDDGYVHRMTMNISAHNPANAKDTAAISIRMDLFDFGAVVTVPHPTPDDAIPFPKLLQRIGQGG